MFQHKRVNENYGVHALVRRAFLGFFYPSTFSFALTLFLSPLLSPPNTNQAPATPLFLLLSASRFASQSTLHYPLQLAWISFRLEWRIQSHPFAVPSFASIWIYAPMLAYRDNAKLEALQIRPFWCCNHCALETNLFPFVTHFIFVFDELSAVEVFHQQFKYDSSIHYRALLSQCEWQYAAILLKVERMPLFWRRLTATLTICISIQHTLFTLVKNKIARCRYLDAGSFITYTLFRCNWQSLSDNSMRC